MAKLVVADLEALFTANTKDIERADKMIVAVGKKVEGKPLKIGADAKDALGSMDRVEKTAKKLVSERAVVKLDADISRAETNLGKAIDKLEDLQIRAEGGIDVTADVKRAEASIQRFERQLDGLKKARNVVDVEVDEDKAESNLKRFLSLFKKKTEEAGDEGGRSLSQGLDAATRGAGEKVGDVVGGDIEKTLVDALSAIPIAGGIILAGVAIGKAITGAIQDGLAVEQRQDRLQALTGISEADAIRLSRAAGEAYANNFGESIESNMDASRLALQFRILDPSATTRDAQLVVQGLSGIADVLGTDVKPVAESVAQLLSTGMVKNSKAAFDLIAAGARNGADRSEDLLETLTEYPALFQRLGLSGEESLGLISQGMKAGARNSDLAADALKEFQIRSSTDLANATTGFELLGLGVEESMAKAASGGAGAREVLGETLSRLREMPDGFDKSTAAAALFGTQAEDLGAALFAMDLNTAVAQLDGVSGAAQRMFDTLASNDASKIEQAQRSIEVAADGIKGALAAAFADPLGELADFVSENRGPVLQFFRDMAVGAIDFAISASDATGEFVSGPLADMLEGFVSFLKLTNFDPMKDWTDIDGLVSDLRDFDDVTDSVTTNLQGMKREITDFTDPVIDLAFASDAALRTADAISRVGVSAADGTAMVGAFRISQEGAVVAGLALQEQLDRSAQALRDEYDAAIAAGNSQENLQERYYATRDALMAQLTAMGMTTEQAQALIDTVLQTPEEASTYYTSNADSEKAKVIDLGNRIITMPDGDTTITADTRPATTMIDSLITTTSGKQIKIKVFADGSGFRLPGGQVVTPQASGHIVEFMAAGGLRGATPMEPLAQMVPPSTWRIVGDRSDVPEAYIPLDGSPRSIALLMEAFNRMPGMSPMAAGGVSGPAVVQQNIEGLSISGVFEIGGDGLGRIIDGRIERRGRKLTDDLRGRRRSDA